jgi:hypothetical protein
LKIAIISNCQGDGLAYCINAMNPELNAKFILFTEFSTGTQKISDILADYDFVFAQPYVKHDVPPEFAAKVFYFPSIAFAGYHPDMTYARGKRADGEWETVHGVMSSYHSAIAIFGFCMGIPLDQIEGFYNPYAFGKLGYFDVWPSSRQELIDEGASVDMPLGALFKKWTRRGGFMYSFNHPEIAVMADIARRLLETANLAIVNRNVEKYIHDPLRDMPIWPIYPAIARRLNIEGDTTFRCNYADRSYSLRAFLEESYRVYEKYGRDAIQPLNFSIEDFARKLDFMPGAAETKKSTRNPYAGLPRTQFWKEAVANLPAEKLDPVVDPRFTISRTQKVATAGSCFAQHIARTLSRSGFDYFVSETAPVGLSPTQAHERNFGVFSARYGNIYTVRQLVQLLQRVAGRFEPYDIAWKRKDGVLVDPFRPQVEPAGFGNTEALLASRAEHFDAVRRMVSTMDVFVFTLGLTEGWRSKMDGAVFPLAPGVAGGEVDFDRYEFVNFTAEEVSADLQQAIDVIKTINPQCKVILTVSPVPLIATYEPKHALVATTYSKSVLRVAAEEAVEANPHVDYFPSYEIIVGNYNKGAYYEDDMRSVREEGVSHVMGVFMKHYAEGAAGADQGGIPAAKPEPVKHKRSALMDTVCDEDAIVNFSPDVAR